MIDLVIYALALVKRALNQGIYALELIKHALALVIYALVKYALEPVKHAFDVFHYAIDLVDYEEVYSPHMPSISAYTGVWMMYS